MTHLPAPSSVNQLTTHTPSGTIRQTVRVTDRPYPLSPLSTSDVDIGDFWAVQLANSRRGAVGGAQGGSPVMRPPTGLHGSPPPVMRLVKQVGSVPRHARLVEGPRG